MRFFWLEFTGNHPSQSFAIKSRRSSISIKGEIVCPKHRWTPLVYQYHTHGSQPTGDCFFREENVLIIKPHNTVLMFETRPPGLGPANFPNLFAGFRMFYSTWRTHFTQLGQTSFSTNNVAKMSGLYLTMTVTMTMVLK